jgi:predicted DNA-binding protein
MADRLTEVLNVRIEAEVDRALELVASATGRSKSAIVRYAVLTYLDALSIPELFELPEPVYTPELEELED